MKNAQVYHVDEVARRREEKRRRSPVPITFEKQGEEWVEVVSEEHPPSQPRLPLTRKEDKEEARWVSPQAIFLEGYRSWFLFGLALGIAVGYFPRTALRPEERP